MRTGPRYPTPSSATFNRIALTVALAGSLDLVLKALFASQLSPGERRPLIDHILALTFVANDRTAMGLFGASPVLLVLGALLVVVLVTALLHDRLRRSVATQVAFGAIVGGAFGNVVDRAQHGYVLDYVAIPHFYVFNFADACISCGVAAVALVALRDRA